MKNQKKIIILSLTVLMALTVKGYNAKNGKITQMPITQKNTTKTTITNLSQNKKVSNQLIDKERIFDVEDTEQTVNLKEAVTIKIDNNKNINIDKAGTYVISGSGNETTITIDVNNKENVNLVLDNVNIINTDLPTINVKNAKKVFVNTTKNSQNKLEVTGDFKKDGENKNDAVIFSKSDLVLNGTGNLTINSVKGNAISSEDKLKITGGTYVIDSGKHSLEGYNSVVISDGNFTINSSKDGIHSENSEDDSLGYVYISGGTFNINSGDDGIQATTFAIIDGGNFNIDGVEGIEATYVQINNGDISIKASDDGINAAQKTTKYDINIEVNGGNINVVMADGDTDGFDSNGNLTINGGNINVTGNSAFDFDGVGKLNDGNIIVNGKKMTTLTNQTFGRFPRRR